ncbi:hypothetical protein ILUMI_15705 [Ignelater luminosus]|uniref:Clip domain-containing protein n=1 Tax=Ignelater luminosus TaxID=2038154 RepID=A0A8K0CN34_IGNLU|nr:hypothetical protein ILUMI_15705 [Ignelater luminosus]
MNSEVDFVNNMGTDTIVVFLFLVHFCDFKISVAIAGQSNVCQTPENTTGQCVIIQNCSALYSLVQKRPIPEHTIAYLRRAHCGFTGSQPNVCCPITTKNPIG